MSRATQNFAAFFPSAPRAAKDKAKEREKSKSQSLESPGIRPSADTHVVSTNSRAGDTGSSRSTKESLVTVTDIAAPQAEDNESISGDILNGVGSASSHTSTVSSVFSAPAQQSNMSTSGGARNVSSLTPLTNTESSPLRIPSPKQSKPGALPTISSVSANEKAVLDNDSPPAQPALADQLPSDPRVYARDPNRGIKGIICTYDPLLDRKLGSNEKKKAKPIYKEFGLVRKIKSAGSVILFV
jgi:[histone H3]-lysine4 N-trimethyltransferase SETD1